MPESIHKYHFPKDQVEIQVAAFITHSQSTEPEQFFDSWKILVSNRDCVILRLLRTDTMENIEMKPNVNFDSRTWKVTCSFSQRVSPFAVLHDLHDVHDQLS
jgi:hypothetical protein